jgi:hypothetical protein
MDKIYFRGNIMQRALFKPWYDLNQFSLSFYKESSQSQTAVLNDLIKIQWGPASWAKLAQASMRSFKTWSEANESTFNRVWQTQLSKLDLGDSAAALRELNEITMSFVTTLLQNQVNGTSLFVEAWAKYLESLKQAKSVEDAIAVQAHFFSDTHEKLKTNSLETLQTLGSVRTALTAWTEKTIDNAAEEENVPQAVASKRAASK